MKTPAFSLGTDFYFELFRHHLSEGRAIQLSIVISFCRIRVSSEGRVFCFMADSRSMYEWLGPRNLVFISRIAEGIAEENKIDVPETDQPEVRQPWI